MTEHHLARAYLLVEQRNFREAERELTAVLEQEPNRPEALRMLAFVYIQTDRLKEGQATAQLALEADPGEAESHYMLGFAHLQLGQWVKAEERLQSAVELSPREARYFSLWAAVALQRKQNRRAVDLARQALALDPENMQALNVQAMAERNLGQTEASEETLRRALEREPDNSGSHANLGWNQLNQGQSKKALEHFREALRLDPNNEYAKAGMVQALKARYWIYRPFLSFFLWMSKQSSQVQWGVVIGVFVGNSLIIRAIDSYPDLAPYLNPLRILIVVFALGTWVISPLFNLLLFLNPYGKYALDKGDRQVARLTGVALACGLLFLGLYVYTQAFYFIMVALYFGLMMIPLSTLNSAGTTKGRRIIKLLTSGLAALGFVTLLLILLVPTGDYSGLVNAFVIGVFGFQWIANFVIVRSN